MKAIFFLLFLFSTNFVEAATVRILPRVGHDYNPIYPSLLGLFLGLLFLLGISSLTEVLAEFSIHREKKRKAKNTIKDTLKKEKRLAINNQKKLKRDQIKKNRKEQIKKMREDKLAKKKRKKQSQ
ncbi:hypothetical protein A9G35_04390 [Gilliamella sp. Choc5-1]|jgi:hypothetical protein|uniref:hypothetical protein n=1 Tax=Gilliamella sp. Choc5-1 TaxID=3120238 RepID=UPI00080D9FA8|nr:hypothetical protein [Gilliamella apicola]OCG46898.1 hypothetical protein A9G35_04390 [Gilliamella apicola]